MLEKYLYRKKIVVYLVGDSIMAKKLRRQYPIAGWGNLIQPYFDDQVKVLNKAKDGSSTKTFLKQGRWRRVSSNLKKGDFILIGFGHNDEAVHKKKGVYPEQFKQNLSKMIVEARNKHAHPILLTPVVRRCFDGGRILDRHKYYSAVIKELAFGYSLLLIDLDRISMSIMNDLGPEGAKAYYNWLNPFEYANYPYGAMDDSHLNSYGAAKISSIIVKEIKAGSSGLEKYTP